MTSATVVTAMKAGDRHQEDHWPWRDHFPKATRNSMKLQATQSTTVSQFTWQLLSLETQSILKLQKCSEYLRETELGSRLRSS